MFFRRQECKIFNHKSRNITNSELARAGLRPIKYDHIKLNLVRLLTGDGM